MDIITDEDQWTLASRRAAGRSLRRFTLQDGMILIVAAALASAMLRPFWDGGLRNYPAWGQAIGFILVGLVSVTPTLLAIRLVRPRPTLRQLCRRPGFVATLAGSAILGLSLLAVLVIGLVRTFNGRVIPQNTILMVTDHLWWANVVLHFGVEVGPAVIAAWILLALSGRRRPSRDWLDSAGRAVGTAWITLFAINAIMRLHYLVQ